MNKKPKKRIFGLTQTEFFILFTLGGLLLCVIGLFGGYIIYDLNRPAPVAVLPPTSIPQPIIQPTTSLPIKPSDTPIPLATFTSEPTNTSIPDVSPLIATYDNPVPMGTGYTFPGFGTLSVTKSYWSPGQTGLTVIELAFSCELPAGQECKLLIELNLDALGSSGNGYKQKFDNSIPLPDFMSLLNPPLFGGGSTKGNVGFLITNTENFLLMRVERFPNKGTYFFRISE